MTWNYRVVRDEDGLCIFDIYYNEAGQAVASGIDPTYVYGDELEDLKARLMLMLEALEKPILEKSQIGVPGAQGQDVENGPKTRSDGLRTLKEPP